MSTTSNGNVRSFSYVTDILTDPVSDDISLVSMNESGCILVNFSALRFRDESNDVVGTITSNIINNVCYAIFMPALFFIGFPSNIVNLLVFFKHGLKQRINLCLFCLSLMDLIFLTIGFMLFAEKLQTKDFTASYRRMGVLAQFIINNHIIGCYAGFGWASQFVSAIISGERCLCVVWPLRSATVLKTKTLGIFLLVWILLIIGARFVAGRQHSVVCVMDVVTEITSLQMISSEFYKTYKNLLNVLDGTVFGLVLPFTLFGFVIITTSITAIKLRQSVEFQRESSSSSSSFLSAREIALTRMLIYLSIQFTILNMPNMLLRVCRLFLPDFNPSGNWVNLYFLMVAIVDLCTSLSSSLNILIYYIFGSKYRETLREITCMRKRTNGIIHRKHQQ